MPTQSAFPKLFSEYYAIHETIHQILKEGENPRSNILWRKEGSLSKNA